jgi:hypothetical protein
MIDGMIETNLFDQEELHTDCTVQVLTNSVTGECSVGWWDNSHPPEEVKGELGRQQTKR